MDGARTGPITRSVAPARSPSRSPIESDPASIPAITVRVTACPHALRLAIPLVVSIATERAARAGVLVKDRLALESMRGVDAVLFDKTGPLTKGEPTVTGIAIGAGTDVAIASAGVILASDDPRSVVSVIELSQASYRKMKQNLWWAAGYNLLSVLLAAGVLAPIGFVLPMSVGAVLMSLSTIVVALNAQVLRRLDLRPERVVGR